jgi:hypothetical protein
MTIREFYLNEDTGGLYVEFSTKKDGDDFYRVIELTRDDIEYYSPTILDEEVEIDEDFISELLFEYSKHNDLPEEEML